MVFPWFSNGFPKGFPTGLPAFRASGTGEGDRAAFDLASKGLQSFLAWPKNVGQISKGHKVEYVLSIIYVNICDRYMIYAI